MMKAFVLSIRRELDLGAGVVINGTTDNDELNSFSHWNEQTCIMMQEKSSRHGEKEKKKNEKDV